MLSGGYRKRPMTRNESNRILSESLLQIFKVWTYKTYLKRSRSRTSISTIFEIKRWDLHDEFRYQLDKCQIIRHSNTSNQSSHHIFSIGEFWNEFESFKLYSRKYAWICHQIVKVWFQDMLQKQRCVHCDPVFRSIFSVHELRLTNSSWSFIFPLKHWC